MKNYIREKIKYYNIEIDDDDFEYGFTILSNYLIFAMIIFPFILSDFLNTILFLIFYLHLKQYTGGFHFSSAKLCMITSVLLTAIIPKVAKLFVFNNILIALTCVIISIVIHFIKTEDHPNKILSVQEINFFTKKSIRTIFIYGLFCVFLNLFNLHNIVSEIMITTICCLVEIVIAKTVKTVYL